MLHARRNIILPIGAVGHTLCEGFFCRCRAHLFLCFSSRTDHLPFRLLRAAQRCGPAVIALISLDADIQRVHRAGSAYRARLLRPLRCPLAKIIQHLADLIALGALLGLPIGRLLRSRSFCHHLLRRFERSVIGPLLPRRSPLFRRSALDLLAYSSSLFCMFSSRLALFCSGNELAPCADCGIHLGFKFTFLFRIKVCRIFAESAFKRLLRSVDLTADLSHSPQLIRRMRNVTREQLWRHIAQFGIGNVYRQAALVHNAQRTDGGLPKVSPIRKIRTVCLVQCDLLPSQVVLDRLILVIESVIDHNTVHPRLFKYAVHQRLRHASGIRPLFRDTVGRLAERCAVFRRVWNVHRLHQLPPQRVRRIIGRAPLLRLQNIER